MRFDCISPTDFRYGVAELTPYLSEAAFIKYKARVELALIESFTRRNICSEEVLEEVSDAVSEISAEEVYEAEKRTKHDVKALIDVIQGKVSDAAKPFVHLTATSYDIVDTANALRYKDVMDKVILPDMVRLERRWIELARKEKDTVQIGRTHGQHAEPITFGFFIAQYVDRWGERILAMKESTDKLMGKFSGAVGTYASQNLIFDDPRDFERDLMHRLGLKSPRISTQIVPPEPLTDFIHSIISSFGVLANFADDMRHLQRTEIGEVMEFFGERQIGSSTMPHKRNPVGFENVKSLWKQFMPQMMIAYQNQISEHQRDLTGSAAQRYIPELLAMFDYAVRRLESISERLKVDKGHIKRNLATTSDKVIAEPLQILLAINGHPDSYEIVRDLTLESYETGKPLRELIAPYVDEIRSDQEEVLLNPEKYTGIASDMVEEITDYWRRIIKEISD